MISYPILKPQPSGTFIVYEDYTTRGEVVPKGFSTDGLTLKIRVLRLMVDKYQPKFAPFFVLHDYLCSNDRYEEADRLGKEVLFEIEYSRRTRLMMWAIRLYHKIKYGVK